jgi:hypothetical protein
MYHPFSTQVVFEQKNQELKFIMIRKECAGPEIQRVCEGFV